MAESLTFITNNTMHYVHLPPVPNTVFASAGIRLIPGLNRVPTAYMKALTERASPVHDAAGRPQMVSRQVTEDVVLEDEKGKKRVEKVLKTVSEPILEYPGQAALRKLTQVSCRIVTSQGRHFGPMLTIHAEGTIDPNSPDGPPPPVDLPANEVHAIHLVEQTTDEAALRRWGAFDPRDAVKAAVSRKLGGR